MRNPLIAEIRRIRAKMAREWARNPNYFAELRERFLKVYDVVLDEKGKPHYFLNKEKVHDVLIAPRLAEEAARSKDRARRRTTSRTAQSKSSAQKSS